MAVARNSPEIVVLPLREGDGHSAGGNPEFAAWLPLGGILLGFISLLYLAEISELASTGYSIQELQTEESYWTSRNQQLVLDLAKARSLAALGPTAIDRLAMAPPRDVVYLKVSPVAVPSRAKPSSRGQDGSPVRERRAWVPSNRLLDPLREAFSSLIPPRLRPQVHLP